MKISYSDQWQISFLSKDFVDDSIFHTSKNSTTLMIYNDKIEHNS